MISNLVLSLFGVTFFDIFVNHRLYSSLKQFILIDQTSLITMIHHETSPFIGRGLNYQNIHFSCLIKGLNFSTSIRESEKCDQLNLRAVWIFGQQRCSVIRSVYRLLVLL